MWIIFTSSRINYYRINVKQDSQVKYAGETVCLNKYLKVFPVQSLKLKGKTTMNPLYFSIEILDACVHNCQTEDQVYDK